MGNYFSEAGYRTVYKGKWHVAESSLFSPGTHDQLVDTFDANGVPDPQPSRSCTWTPNVLDPYGFDGWVGPEPHPTQYLQRGSAEWLLGRRPACRVATSSTAIRSFSRSRTSTGDRSDNRPWVIVVVFVDPHDIALVRLANVPRHLARDRGIGQKCGPIFAPAFLNNANVPPPTSCSTRRCTRRR